MGAVFTIELRQGVAVEMLFTPRLYEFRGREGVTLEYEQGDAASVQSLYADVMYCAALNHWTLTHSGEEEFPHRRMDFHVFSVERREMFGKAMIFAMETLSGKSVRELLESSKKGAEVGDSGNPEGIKKKPLRGLIMRLLRRS